MTSWKISEKDERTAESRKQVKGAGSNRGREGGMNLIPNTLTHLSKLPQNHNQNMFDKLRQTDNNDVRFSTVLSTDKSSADR